MLKINKKKKFSPQSRNPSRENIKEKSDNIRPEMKANPSSRKEKKIIFSILLLQGTVREIRHTQTLHSHTTTMIQKTALAS